MRPTSDKRHATIRPRAVRAAYHTRASEKKNKTQKEQKTHTPGHKPTTLFRGIFERRRGEGDRIHEGIEQGPGFHHSPPIAAPLKTQGGTFDPPSAETLRNFSGNHAYATARNHDRAADLQHLGSMTFQRLTGSTLLPSRPFRPLPEKVTPDRWPKHAVRR